MKRIRSVGKLSPAQEAERTAVLRECARLILQGKHGRAARTFARAFKKGAPLMLPAGEARTTWARETLGAAVKWGAKDGKVGWWVSIAKKDPLGPFGSERDADWWIAAEVRP